MLCARLFFVYVCGIEFAVERRNGLSQWEMNRNMKKIPEMVRSAKIYVCRYMIKSLSSSFIFFIGINPPQSLSRDKIVFPRHSVQIVVPTILVVP